MLTGAVKKFFTEKGWGFIIADDGSGDVFAPGRTFKGNEAEIREGLRVTYEPGVDNSTGKTRAASWMPAEGALQQQVMAQAQAQFQMPGLAAAAGGGANMGTLKNFFPEKGFGFITRDDDGTDIFAPARTFTGGEGNIKEGIRVSFQPGVDDKTGKPRAASWSVVDIGSAMAGYGAMSSSTLGMDRFSPYGAASVSAFAGLPGMGMSAGLPLGWEQATDPSSGRTYYANRTTGETSWTPPAMPAMPAMAAAAAAPALPAGWEQASDPASGKTYYFNRALNQTTWEVPSA